ncbi:MinD/ParA family protein [Methanolobus sp. ZRKC2]|uniref:MinD/ParA family ATP-binding protein n=1 Tax=Methanolobus sp. ZRKC2 TaxID=3125783 RepID=UPI00324E08D5
MLLSFHSYKGGTGKTTLVGNLGVLLAMGGEKVCIVDTDVNGPGIHSLFDIKYNLTLIDFLQGKCRADDVVYKHNELELYIVPARACEEDISSLFNTPTEAKEKMSELINVLQRDLSMDHLLFDCSPGINRSSLLTMNLVDKATIISTVDVQDIRGTYILSSMADKLGTRANLLFNRTPRDKQQEIEAVIKDFSNKLGTDLLGSITFDDHVARAWSRKLVMEDDPECDYCLQLKSIAKKLI